MNIKFSEKINELKNFCLERKKEFSVVAGTLALAGVLAISCGISNKKDSNVVENQIGYEDVNTAFNGLKNVFGKGVKENEFVILNVGDSKEYGVFNQDKKIKYCNEKDIALGIIVTPTSIYEHDIYDDVELVRGIINEYDINFPVYLDINSIIENNDINNNTKINIIKTFMDKCTANGIYVGVYGTDTNLVYLNKYCKITEFDAFVVMDKEKIEYEGTYNIVKDLDGNITSKTNLEESINKKGLNEKNRLKNDGLYTVQEGDILLEIAMKYDLSVNALLKYNDIKEKDFVPGLTIKIPSIINNIIPNNSQNESYEILDEPIIGADLSRHQSSANWDTLKDNFEFIILRSGRGSVTDTKFEEFSTQCNTYNIPMGIYHYNDYYGVDYDNTTFRQLIEEQANKCLELIANKNIDYPVYFDLEPKTYKDGTSDNIKEKQKPEHIKLMLDIWKEKISAAGYTIGLYCNKETYSYILESYDKEELEDFEIWIASYGNNKERPLSEVTAPNSRILNYDNKEIIADTIQISDQITEAGAGNDAGKLDIDFSYIDYTQPIINDNVEYSEDLMIKDIDRSWDKTVIYTCLGLSSILAPACIIKARKNKNKIRRK